MAVPTRPVEGAPVDTVWGGVVHDGIVALEIQTGSVTGMASGAAGAIVSKAVVFPHPFAGVPVVAVNGSVPVGPSCAWAVSVTASGFTYQTCRVDGGNGGFSAGEYIAYGPRA